MTQRKPAPSREQMEQLVHAVVANEPVFAVGEVDVFGVKQPGYVNAPPDLRFVLLKAMEHADKTAVVYEGTRWTYGELVGKSVAVANGLRARADFEQGTRVALALRNCPEWMAAFLGVIAAGGVVVPLNGWWTTSELEYALKDCQAKLVIAGTRQSERLNPIKAELGLTLIAGYGEQGEADGTLAEIMAAGANQPPPEIALAPEDDFAIFYTSGSTGAPKGAVLTQRGVVTTVLSYALLGAGLKLANEGEDFFGSDPGILVAVPLFHCTGSHAVFLMSLIAGRKMVLMRKWDAGEAVDLVQSEKLTNMVGVPTMTHEITLEAERRGVSLDTLMDMGSGGAKRPAAHVKKLNETFPQAWSSSGYGLTETNALGTYNGLTDYQARPGSCGRPVPAVTQVKTVRADGSDAATGEEGEVWIRSPAVFRGYLNQPEATAAVLTEDRWFKTGDLGIIDEEGFLSIVDRLKDMILRGGENISCLEVEGALAQHPDVLESAVIGIPDERLGERVGAAIVMRPDSHTTDADISAFLEPLLAPYKRPEVFWRMDGPLPRVGTGKIDKPGLRLDLLAPDNER